MLLVSGRVIHFKERVPKKGFLQECSKLNAKCLISVDRLKIDSVSMSKNDIINKDPIKDFLLFAILGC